MTTGEWRIIVVLYPAAASIDGGESLEGIDDDHERYSAVSTF
jgi:hypothetical protein